MVEQRSPKPRVQSSSLCAPAKKSKSKGLDFFICAERHNIICVAHATSLERQPNIIAARFLNNYPKAREFHGLFSSPALRSQNAGSSPYETVGAAIGRPFSVHGDAVIPYRLTAPLFL